MYLGNLFIGMHRNVGETIISVPYIDEGFGDRRMGSENQPNAGISPGASRYEQGNDIGGLGRQSNGIGAKRTRTGRLIARLDLPVRILLYLNSTCALPQSHDDRKDSLERPERTCFRVRRARGDVTTRHRAIVIDLVCVMEYSKPAFQTPGNTQRQFQPMLHGVLGAVTQCPSPRIPTGRKMT